MLEALVSFRKLFQDDKTSINSLFTDQLCNQLKQNTSYSSGMRGMAVQSQQHRDKLRVKIKSRTMNEENKIERQV